MAEPATRRKQQRVEAVGIAANQPIRLRFRASPTSRNGGAVLRTGKGDTWHRITTNKSK